MSQLPIRNEAAPIGAFVRQHLPQILAYCQANPEEFANLQDREYCLTNFRQSYAVLRARTGESKPSKCWAAKSSGPFSDAGYWVTSEWVSNLHTAHFIVYLISKGIEPIGVSEDFIAWAQETVDEFGTTSAAPGGARYRSTALGVAQNALVRYLLSNLPYETFAQDDWEAVKARDFGGTCAYCGETKKTTIDHAVPINRIHLGEHRLGNLVPACGSCNGRKSNTTYTEFLETFYAADPEQARMRIGDLDTHAAKHDYQPIEDHEGVRPIIEEARAKLAEVASLYLDRINEQLAQQRGC
ncbi:HNH endonuclease signature motif containing protein [Nocardioides sp. GY 10113]|uniref:HNH endonuclease n=1 Tax=Nocardioides sp. GY 10113 TaxID=2569761 RepID=UPI00145819C3|nr:HNH endonuclease signature motif containing protein [Nocardioides sp. GY 10113]